MSDTKNNYFHKKIKAIAELVRYGFAGGLCTILNLILFVFFEEFGIYYLLANAMAYAIAVVVNFLMNKYFVFKEANCENDFRQLYQFVLMRILSLIIDSALFFILVDICHINTYISRVGLSAFLIIATFFINRKMIFK